MNTPSEFGEFGHIVAVKRWTLLFSALVIGGALLCFGPRAQLGALLGAGLMLLNTWLLGRLGLRLFASISGGRLSVVAIVVLFNLKLAGLAVLCYLCVRYLPVDPVAFLVGVSVLPAAICARAVQHSLRPLPAATPSAPAGEG